MNNKSLIVIVFSAIVLLLLGSYWFVRERGLLSDRNGSPILAPPELTPKEKERILSTLNARQKENLTPQQKTKILKSLTAPGE